METAALQKWCCATRRRLGDPSVRPSGGRASRREPRDQIQHGLEPEAGAAQWPIRSAASRHRPSSEMCLQRVRAQTSESQSTHAADPREAPECRAPIRPRAPPCSAPGTRPSAPGCRWGGAPAWPPPAPHLRPMTEAGHHPTTCVSNRRAGCLAGTLHTATQIRRGCCLDVEVYHYESQLNDIALRCPGRVLAAPVQRVREGWDSEAAYSHALPSGSAAPHHGWL